MRRAALLFFASILLPSLVLAWLAVRSVRDQQVVLEHQQAIICQNITDALAANLEGQMDQVRADFVKTTQEMLGMGGGVQGQGSVVPIEPEALARNFNHRLREAWPLAEIGFAVNLSGQIYSPTAFDGPAARTFRDENDRFLSNRENVEVYSSNAAQMTQNGALIQNAAAQFALKLPLQAPLAKEADTQKALKPEADLQGKLQIVDAVTKVDKDEYRSADMKTAKAVHAEPAPVLDGSSASPGAPAAGAAAAPVSAPADASSASAPAASPAPLGGEAETMAVPTVPATAAAPVAADEISVATANAPALFNKIQRNVIPQQMLARDSAAISSTVPEESDFRRVIGAETNGELARFLEDKMRLLVWMHPSADAPIVFGAQLDQARLVEALKSCFQIAELQNAERSSSFSSRTRSQYCVAILDDNGRVAASSIDGFTADWKHPFVATEIGEVLPHWEAALYLVDPQQFSRAARTLKLTFGLIVLLLVAAIVSGGSLIAADVRRQVRLAQQKTDFVSNVSHELKTPLTSIRMFADLLAEKRVPDEERQATYLRIIAAEAARLTRLINNVLDFARLEKGAPHGEHAACDLVEAVRDVTETCAPHLEAAGIAFRCEIETDALPIRGDRDALAQIILNLVSNAEKYGGGDILVRVRRQEIASGALGCVDVLDRGAGIPARQVKTIFEPFHRLDDSLASGIPGSGLGLTLARRMARAHGGDVTYSARAGGGSCFTLAVPLTELLK
jgi:signal transduction histidine kinase